MALEDMRVRSSLTEEARHPRFMPKTMPAVLTPELVLVPLAGPPTGSLLSSSHASSNASNTHSSKFLHSRRLVTVGLRCCSEADRAGLQDPMAGVVASVYMSN
jgi:hypothetical protein